MSRRFLTHGNLSFTCIGLSVGCTTSQLEAASKIILYVTWYPHLLRDLYVFKLLSYVACVLQRFVCSIWRKSPWKNTFLLCDSFEVNVHLNHNFQALDYENQSGEILTTAQWIQPSCSSDFISFLMRNDQI